MHELKLYITYKFTKEFTSKGWTQRNCRSKY